MSALSSKMEALPKSSRPSSFSALAQKLGLNDNFRKQERNQEENVNFLHDQYALAFDVLVRKIYEGAVATGYKGPAARSHEVKGMGGNSLYESQSSADVIHPRLREHIANSGLADYQETLERADHHQALAQIWEDHLRSGADIDVANQGRHHMDLARLDLTQLYQSAVATGYKGPVAMEYQVAGMGGNSLYASSTKESTVHPKLRAHVQALPANHIMREHLTRFDHNLSQGRQFEKCLADIQAIESKKATAPTVSRSRPSSP
jgi:hypothetical protein